MKLKLLSSILTLCFFGILSAQNYPVTVVPQAVSPSPIYFSSYADAGTVNSPLRVQLLLNDITLSNIEVRLKTYFEGNGIRFESNNAVVGANPIYLEGGVPVNLTNIQLAPFYSLQNISGVNSNQYAQPIPEGSYQFCFEVYDAFTGNRLSARSCATTYIFKNEPPFLVLPHKNETIDVRNPQNIVFQWTPRHINVSNVEYELSIVEIWDNYVDPQAAFFSMPPIFQATTRNTSYLLGPADPILLPNKKYAWRVQAKAISGTEEIGLFNNNGYSEIFWFSHSQPCEIPANIKSEVKGTHQANIEWDDFSTEIPEYKVRYREKNSSSQGDWFYSRSNTNWVTIWDLRPGTTYEYQVNRKCQLIESEYSPVKTFTTFLADDESGLYNCGISPEIDITNADPLPDLFVNDVFKAGDFPIKVLEVSGSSGRFTGKGYVSMPYLKNIKVAVEFTNILINTDKNLIEGMVITKYDPTWSNILDTDGVIDSVEDIVDVFTGGDNTILDPVDYDIKTVTIKDGQIVVTGTNGEQTTYDYDEGDTYQISGTNGVFAIDKNGKVSQIGETAEGGPATAENTEGINTSGNGTVESPSVAQVYTEGATVIFRKGSETKYELDMVDNSFEQSTYPKAQRSDGKDYYPVHKAVVNGNKDIFYADITITNNAINIDSLVFKTVETGLKLTTEKVDNDTYKIEVEGRNAYRNEEAIITYKDATGQQRVIASFFIHHLHKLQTRKVQIVSVNGASAIEGLGATLNTVFGVAGASFDVKSDIHKINIDPSVWDIDEKNDVLDYNGSGLLPDYPKEIRAIHQYYMANTANYDAGAYYVFLVDNSIKVSKAINGFMPKGRQFGYIFNAHKDQGLESKDTQSKVVAHELGHGVFSLEHPFESDSNAGNTKWLMDYADGTQLPFAHWAVMSETGLNLQLFQDDSQGEFSNTHLTPNWTPFNYSESDTYIAPDQITEPNGAVYGISKDNKQYFWDGDNYSLNGEKLPISLVENITDGSRIQLYWNRGQCGYNEYYYTTWGYIKNKKGQVNVDNVTDGSITSGGRIACIVKETNIGGYRDDDKCEGKDLSSLNKQRIEIEDLSKILGSTETIEIVNKVKALDICALRRLDYSVVEVLLKRLASESNFTEDLELAILKLMNSIKEDNYNNFYSSVLSESNYNILKNLLNKMTNKKFLFFDDNTYYNSFIETLAYITSKLDQDTKKWNVVNSIVKERYDELNEYDLLAFETIFSSITEYSHIKNKIDSISQLFKDMLIEDCNMLDDYKIIFDIANIRNDNRELFANFTQSDRLQKEIDWALDVYQVNEMSWAIPKDVSLSNGKYFQQSELYKYYEWSKYLKENQSTEDLLKSNPTQFFIVFLEQFNKYLASSIYENQNFWLNIKLETCDDMYRVLNHINTKENVESLRDIDKNLKLKVLSGIFNCEVNNSIGSVISKIDDALIKIVVSFDSDDVEVLTTIENIGFNKIYDKLSGDRLSKFFVWVGNQVVKSNHVIPINSTAILKSDGTMLDKSNLLQLESNIFQFDNFSSNILNKTKIKANDKTIDYNQMVLVYVADDFTFIEHQFKKGDVLVMPLIQAFAMNNSNRNIVATNTTWLAVDVLTFAVGVGEIKVFFTVGNYIRKGIVISDLVGSAAGGVASALNEGAISPDLRFKIQMLSLVASLPQLATSFKNIDNLITSTDNSINALNDATKTKLRPYFDQIKVKISGNVVLTTQLDDILESTLFDNIFKRLPKNTNNRIEMFSSKNSFKEFFIKHYNDASPNSMKTLDEVVDDFENFIINHSSKINSQQVDDFILEMMESKDKFKAAATSLEVIKNPSKYIDNVDGLEGLEDLISSTPDVDGEFRFDIKFRAKLGGNSNNIISVFVDTKNYTSPSNIFKDMSQIKAYLKQINSFEEFRIIQQGGRGFDLKSMKKAFQNALKSNDYEIFDTFWNNQGLKNELFGNISFEDDAFNLFKQLVDDNNHMSKIYNVVKLTY